MRVGLYQHYKGNLYLVKGVARHTETLEPTVFYQSLYGDYGHWVRPQKMFQEVVSFKGKSVDRFTFLRDPFVELPEVKE